MVGGAAGKQDDAIGIPFHGESGRILNLALSLCTTEFHFEISHVVQCRPSTEGKWGEIVNRKPTPQEIEKCIPHLEELTQEVDYDATIQLGDVASSFKIPKKPSLKLRQPADILKKEYKLYDIREFAMKLDNFIETLVCGKVPK